MKLYAALLVLAIAPAFASAKPAAAGQPQTVNRASAHDRHHRHRGTKHHHHAAARHHAQPHAQ
jgi:uncharacterized protein involved in copper resistance